MRAPVLSTASEAASATLFAGSCQVRSITIAPTNVATTDGAELILRDGGAGGAIVWRGKCTGYVPLTRDYGDAYLPIRTSLYAELANIGTQIGTFSVGWTEE